MNVTFGTTVLAPGGTQGADNVRVDGQQIIQEAQFFRGNSAAFYPRGNLATTFQFTTHWIFNTTSAAEIFVLTHTANLPMTNSDRSTVTCQCGAGSATTPVYMANAVLESARIMRYEGISVDVEYTIKGANFQTTAPA